MPTTKNPESTRENENSKRMGGQTSSGSSGNSSRQKSTERSDQNRQQSNQNSRSHRGWLRNSSDAV